MATQSILTRVRGIGFGVAVAALGISAGAQTAFDPNPNVFYRLSTVSRPDLALDVINGGSNNNRLRMAPIAFVSGQFWRFQPIAGFPGSWRISSLFRGPDLPMDIINGGSANNEPRLAPTAFASGQFWRVRQAPGSPDAVTLHTLFRGPGLLLEGHADRSRTRPKLERPNRGLISPGQIWTLTPLRSVEPGISISFGNACEGRGGVPQLRRVGLSTPQAGETFRCAISNVASGAIPALILGSRRSTPLDLAPLGSPGCTFLLDLDVVTALTASNGRAPIDLPIPDDINLVGQRIPIQGVVVDPVAEVDESFLAVTNGLELRVGLR